MALTENASGSTTTTTSEVTASEITSDDFNYWGAKIFIPASFTTGDLVEIRFYDWDPVFSGLQTLYYLPITGSTANKETSIYIPPTATRRYKLTFKRTGGIDRSFRWIILKQTG
jgi:hypothetical protein